MCLGGRAQRGYLATCWRHSDLRSICKAPMAKVVGGGLLPGLCNGHRRCTAEAAAGACSCHGKGHQAQRSRSRVKSELQGRPALGEMPSLGHFPPPRLLDKWPPLLKVLVRAGVCAGPAAPTGLGQFCCQGPVLLSEAGRAFGWPKLGRKHFCREGRRLWGRQR